MSGSVGTKLLSEIERVAAMRGQYETMRGVKGVNVEPAIMMMNMALKDAREALADDDALRCISALQNLEGFSE